MSSPSAPAGQTPLRIMVVSAISRESSSCHVLAMQIAEMVAAEPGVEVDYCADNQIALHHRAIVPSFERDTAHSESNFP